jgi:hypothetical protein
MRYKLQFSLVIFTCFYELIYFLAETGLLPVAAVERVAKKLVFSGNEYVAFCPTSRSTIWALNCPEMWQP